MQDEDQAGLGLGLALLITNWEANKIKLRISSA
jgi:hypothetical protein